MSSQLNQLLDFISDIPDGSKKITMLEEAIRLADYENILPLQLDLRYELIYNSVFYGDRLKIITTFPRYLSLIDDNIDKVTEEDILHQLWGFKYILDHAVDFYQISWSKINSLTQEFKNRCIQYGYSLRYYYEIKTKHNMYLKKIDEAKDSFDRYWQCTKDELSDCDACELDFHVQYYLFINDYELAMKAAKPIFQGELKCKEVPHITYPKFLLYYISQGRLQESKEIVDKSYKLIQNNESFLEYLEGYITYYAMTNPLMGIKIFTDHLKWALDSRNERHKLVFFTTSWQLWESLATLSRKKEYLLSLPENTPFYSEKGKYKIGDIISYCKKQAMLIAANFDRRDGMGNALDYINSIKANVANNRRW